MHSAPIAQREQEDTSAGNCAPVVVFGFNRPDALLNTLQALERCDGASETDVFVMLDGPRGPADIEKCSAVKAIATAYTGAFKSYSVQCRNENRGLALALREGVTTLICRFGRIIVLEDDHIVASDFLNYMNQSLAFYQDVPEVGSISAFSLPLNISQQYDNYFHPRSTSWGWATWVDRWQQCDWKLQPSSLREYLSLWFKSRKAGQDVFRMYRHNAKGRINSWSIVWTMFHIRRGWKVSYPCRSRLVNEGFGDDATHCKGENPYKVSLDTAHKKQFTLDPNVRFEPSNLRTINVHYSNLTKLRFKLGLTS